MKKTDKPSRKAPKRTVAARAAREPSDGLRPHYDFDYAAARSNRFASKLADETLIVVLDPDVADVFRSAADVAEEWDREIERDPASGKLDKLFAKSLADRGVGKSREI